MNKILNFLLWLTSVFIVWFVSDWLGKYQFSRIVNFIMRFFGEDEWPYKTFLSLGIVLPVLFVVLVVLVRYIIGLIFPIILPKIGKQYSIIFSKRFLIIIAAICLIWTVGVVLFFIPMIMGHLRWKFL